MFALESRRLLAAAFPSAHEQYLVELINRGRANPSAEATRWGTALNEGLPAGTISTTPKQPLAINPYVTDAARKHSQWMIDTDNFLPRRRHRGPEGSNDDGWLRLHRRVDVGREHRVERRAGRLAGRHADDRGDPSRPVHRRRHRRPRASPQSDGEQLPRDRRGRGHGFYTQRQHVQRGDGDGRFRHQRQQRFPDGRRVQRRRFQRQFLHAGRGTRRGARPRRAPATARSSRERLVQRRVQPGARARARIPSPHPAAGWAGPSATATSSSAART